MVIRPYDVDKKLYIPLFLVSVFGAGYHGPPYVVVLIVVFFLGVCFPLNQAPKGLLIDTNQEIQQLRNCYDNWNFTKTVCYLFCVRILLIQLILLLLSLDGRKQCKNNCETKY